MQHFVKVFALLSILQIPILYFYSEGYKSIHSVDRMVYTLGNLELLAELNSQRGMDIRLRSIGTAGALFRNDTI